MDGVVKNQKFIEEYIVLLILDLGLSRLRKPHIVVKFVNDSDLLGFCVGDTSSVEITICKTCPITKRKLGFCEMMMTLAHEMVHAKQFLRGELISEGQWSWKGKAANNYRYENMPWEREAYRLEKSLYLNCLPIFLPFNN